MRKKPPLVPAAAGAPQPRGPLTVAKPTHFSNDNNNNKTKFGFIIRNYASMLQMKSEDILRC